MYTSNIEIYETRRSRVNVFMSDESFSAANYGGYLSMITDGCIDAPEQLPAGSCKRYGKNDPFVKPVIVSREIDNGERVLSVLSKRLIAEVLAKLEAEREIAK